jgi:hypothetical protein
VLVVPDAHPCGFQTLRLLPFREASNSLFTIHYFKFSISPPKHLFHHTSLDVGESTVKTVVVVGEAFEVEAQQMQHRAVEVPDGGRVHHGAADTSGTTE